MYVMVGIGGQDCFENGFCLLTGDRSCLYFTVKDLISLTFLLDCGQTFLYRLSHRCSPEPRNARIATPDWKSDLGDKSQMGQRVQRFRRLPMCQMALRQPRTRKEDRTMTSYISYVRVSTNRQGRSGLGLAAQTEAIRQHIGKYGTILANYQDIESGRQDNRPELARALDHARRASAVLVIAKLDRLSRNAAFLLNILDSNVDVEFVDMPQCSGPAGRMLLTVMSGAAQLESEMCSQRTKEALAAAKRRGVQLGNPDKGKALTAHIRTHGNGAGVAGCKAKAMERAECWRETLESMISAGLSNCGIARKLNALGEKSVRGGCWTPTAVKVVLGRLEIGNFA